MTITCPACGNAVAGDARDGGLVIKSRAVLYDPHSGKARAICGRCKTEVPITSAAKRLVLPRGQAASS